MALPDFTMRQLLEAGVHFGHQKHRWNPKMASYIYGVRNNIHIIDLAQTVPMLHRALQAVSDTVASGGRVLFVGTKRQAAEPIVAAAKQAAQYYVNARWLGGMLTNWKTISRSIDRLKELDSTLEGGEVQGLTKKERLTLTREREKLENALGGIKDMGGLPDLLFVIDTNKEAIAVQEAQRLNVPVVAIIDTNCNPDGITYPVPGNDDAGRAVTLYCDLIARAAIDGISRAQGAAGIDIGAQEAPVEGALEGEGAGRGGRRGGGRRKPQTLERAAQPDAGAAKSGDDLKKITGIGPALEGKLHGLSITRFEQIANFTPGDVEKLDSELNLKGRIERDDWIAQARALMGQAAAA
jgi:small subunit ribosomal protein S2